MNRKNEKGDFLVALNSVQRGHLIFLSDIKCVTILTDRLMSELAHGSFEHLLPRVRVEENTIMIQYRDFSSLSGGDHLKKKLSAITLNPSIAWEIEFREGVSDLHADLHGPDLRSLDLLGGAHQVELLLPDPIKTSFIYITGGIENSVIRIPAGVGIRVQVSGPIKYLFFDSRYIDHPGGKTSLENAVIQSVPNRYDICISGGASNVTIDE